MEPHGPGHDAPAAAIFAAKQAAASFLLGCVVGWLPVALTRCLAPAFPSLQSPGELTVVCCLCAIALGVRLPRQLAAVLASVVLKRPVASITPGPGFGSRSLLWAVLAVVAMLAGLSVGLLPLALGAADWTHERALAAFFWHPAAHAVLFTFLTAAITIIPMSLVGIGVTCLERLDRGVAVHAPSTVPCLLVGAAAGTLASLSAFAANARPEAMVVSASLPLLAIAIGAILQTKAPAPRGDEDDAVHVQSSAETTGRPSPGRLPWAVLVSGPPALLWLDVLHSQGSSTDVTPAVLLASAAVGAMLGSMTVARARCLLDLAWPSVVAGGIAMGSSVAILVGLDATSSFAIGVAAASTCAGAFVVSGHHHLALGQAERTNAVAARLLAGWFWIPGIALLVEVIVDPGLSSAALAIAFAGVFLAINGLRSLAFVQPPARRTGVNTGSARAKTRSTSSSGAAMASH